MGLYELKNELISKLRAAISMIDGEFEKISSTLGEQMMLSFYSEDSGAISKLKPKTLGLISKGIFRISIMRFGQKWCELLFECLFSLDNVRWS